MNAIAIAFFNPAALANGPCDFSSPTGENPCLNYKRYLLDVRAQLGNLSANTSPKRGQKPVVLFSFGGMNMGGGAWHEVFGSDGKAAQFGENAAALAAALASQVDVIAGIDLDVEGASALPSMGAFMTAFRARAPFDEVPLMLCSFSGLASPDNGEHFKVAIMQQFGPAQKGFTWLNMMVDNQYQSCEGMGDYWLDSRLDFIPANARLFGMWGINMKEWMLKNPGCDDGGSDGNFNLFHSMRTQGVGFAMWEMWIGDVSPIRAIADSIRADGPPSPPTPSPVPTPPVPSPVPTPSGPCHSIGVQVTDDWCNSNCQAVPPNCPATLCKCDSLV